jgi:hypothetical protein
MQRFDGNGAEGSGGAGTFLADAFGNGAGFGVPAPPPWSLAGAILAQPQPAVGAPFDFSQALRSLDRGNPLPGLQDPDATAALSDPPADMQLAAIGDYPPAPPGYDPRTWGHSKWDDGRAVLTDPETQNKYTVHPEDGGHWRHWDIQGPGGEDRGSWPWNRRKPWTTQKVPPYGKQSATDPNGDAPPWQPPFDLFAPLPERMPEMAAPRAPMIRMPILVPP